MSLDKRKTSHPFLFLQTGFKGTFDYIVPFNVAGANIDAVADRYFASPIVIPFRCRIDKIGIYPSVPLTGNCLLGLHRSTGTTVLVPSTKVCGTAAFNANTMIDTAWKWVAPTTAEIVPAGFYFAGWVNSIVYQNGVSGMRAKAFRMDGTDGTTWNDGACAGTYHLAAVGGIVPASLATASVNQNHYMMLLGLKVTPA